MCSHRLSAVQRVHKFYLYRVQIILSKMSEQTGFVHGISNRFALPIP